MPTPDPRPSPRPRKPKAPATPKPWRRIEGRYRSDDDRFSIDGGGAGRWFVTDADSLDDLGLARTVGPFATLDEAKAAAAAMREQGSAASPLADRLAAAKDRPARPAARATRPGRGQRPPGAGVAASKRPATGSHAAGEAPPEPEPRLEPRKTWLEELDDEAPDAGLRAREIIAALEGLGVDDADALVRRDVLGRQPAVAARLLGRAIADARERALDPGALATAGKTSIPDAMRALRAVEADAVAAYAALVADRVLDGVIDVIAVRERAPGSPDGLPGWRLMERATRRDGATGPERRLIVSREDVDA